jgi:hypothetical protein
LFAFLCSMLPVSLDCPLLIASRDTGNIEHKKANKNAINNGQSRDTGNIEHKKANKNATNNVLCSMLPVSLDCPLLVAFLFAFLCSMLPVSLDCPLLVAFLFAFLCSMLPVSLDCPLLQESEQECNQ